MYVVLGRFQPFHKGHAYLVQEALSKGPTVIAIGSSESESTMDNPWSAAEREEMIRAWLAGRDAKIVHIPDINDPPNWVEHATKFHGEGTLVTSDEKTKILYESSNFPVDWVDLTNRESYEGWRVRATLKMLSTVYETDGLREVMLHSIPTAVVDWLIDNDALYRLYSMSRDLEHAG
ncbi:MAG: nicotinamide-nucleotide adenylyltransferase [Methanobacteriota archaeon]|nr:MAG: nicotinamide-nucleotide adenylyltransferase [Euryarchaeota archaeon]